MQYVRSKSGVPSLEDFRASDGTPIVVDRTAVSGGAYFLDDGDRVVAIGGLKVSANDYGAVGDGVTDDTGAIQAAIDAVNAAGGGVVALRPYDIYRITTTLNVQPGVALEGPFSLPDFRKTNNYSTPGVADFETFGGQVVLTNAAGIALVSSASVRGLIIRHENVTSIPFNSGEGGFGTNTAVTLYGNSPVIENCLIVGFELAIFSNGATRPRIRRINIDCKNGIDVLNAADLARVHEVHAWPFLTVGGRAISVDTTNDVITSVQHGFDENDPIYFNIDTPPNPLVSGTTYYAASVTTDTFKVAAAPWGVPIDLTTTGGASCRVNGLGAQLYRTGTAFLNRVSGGGVNDWTRFSDCFGFGYAIGFQNTGANSTIFERCGADSVDRANTYGFYVSGACDEVKFVHCQAAAYDFPFVSDATVGGSGSGTVSVIDCDFWTITSYTNRTAAITLGGSASATVRCDNTKIRGYAYGCSINGASNLLIMHDTSFEQITTGYEYIGAGSLVTTGTTVFGTAIAGVRSVASAATITLPFWSDQISVSGTTNISSINASWNGRVVTLIFQGALTVNDGAGTLRMAGNLVTAADTTLTLVCDGSAWKEIARSIN